MTQTEPGLVPFYDIWQGNWAGLSYNPGARTGLQHVQKKKLTLKQILKLALNMTFQGYFFLEYNENRSAEPWKNCEWCGQIVSL